MRGLWLEDRQLSLRDDLPEPVAGPGDALVRVLRAGICNTDIELLRGYVDFCGIPGHELVGRVEQGPEGLLGQRVVSEINLACGRCRSCRNGLPDHCEQRAVVGIRNHQGAFAELIVLPVANLHLVPDSLSNDVATFAEPLAAALKIQSQVAVEPSDRVLVVGDGKLGQLVARTLALTGCRLIVLGRHRRKLEILERCGITACDQLSPSDRFDLAVECTGNTSGFSLALEALRPRGVLVLKSTYAVPLSCNVAKVVVNEIAVIGSRCGALAPALQLLTTGRVDVEALIDERYPLSQGLAAFAAAQAPATLKVLIELTELTEAV